jgi:hypothetical protein
MYVPYTLTLVSLFWTNVFLSVFLPDYKGSSPNEMLRSHLFRMHESQFSRQKVERAINDGADINTYAVNSQGKPTGRSLLFHAVAIEDFSSVEWLIRHGATVTLEKDALSPIHAACMNGNYEIAHFLITTNPEWLEVTAKNRQNPLHLACISGDQQIVKLLLHYKPSFAYDLNEGGQTPLYLACEYGHCHLVDILHTVDPQLIYQQKGYTSLHHAVVCNQLAIVKRLLELNPTVQTKGWTPEMETALNLAKRNKCTEIIIYLERLKDTLPLYPRSRFDMMKALLENGATPKLAAQYLTNSIPDKPPYYTSLLTESGADPAKVKNLRTIFSSKK